MSVVSSSLLRHSSAVASCPPVAQGQLASSFDPVTETLTATLELSAACAGERVRFFLVGVEPVGSLEPQTAVVVDEVGRAELDIDMAGRPRGVYEVQAVEAAATEGDRGTLFDVDLVITRVDTR